MPEDQRDAIIVGRGLAHVCLQGRVVRTPGDDEPEIAIRQGSEGGDELRDALVGAYLTERKCDVRAFGHTEPVAGRVGVDSLGLVVIFVSAVIRDRDVANAIRRLNQLSSMP